jgi:arylformamidase
MKKIYDISLPVSPKLPVWPGDPPVWMERVQRIEDGEAANVTALRFGAHTGTHMDAPYHFLADGRTIDQIDPAELIGPAQVVRVGDETGLITAEVLDGLRIDLSIPKILFKTRNSQLWARGAEPFDTAYVGIDGGAAEKLVKMGARLIGVDYLSVAPYENQITTHRILLGARVILLEGLNLFGIDPGAYELIALPLKLRGADGAPTRAILMREE